MPEGHTIHRLAGDLTRTFTGERPRVTSPQGRFRDGAKRIDRQRCLGFEAYGKHLIGRFDEGEVLHVHLGLIGKFRKEVGEPVGAVRLRLSVDDLHWDLRGPMICDIGTPDLEDQIAASIGPDPLRRSSKSEDFVAGLRKRRIAVGAALLDQKVIAGIGNVYRAELLFLAGIDPRVPANDLTEDEVQSLWDLSVDQLRKGKRLNRIVTVDPSLVGSKTARSVRPDDRLYVYKRAGEPCRVCETAIVLLDAAGRKMWMCPTCQASSNQVEAAG